MQRAYASVIALLSFLGCGGSSSPPDAALDLTPFASATRPIGAACNPPAFGNATLSGSLAAIKSAQLVSVDSNGMVFSLRQQEPGERTCLLPSDSSLVVFHAPDALSVLGDHPIGLAASLVNASITTFVGGQQTSQAFAIGGDVTFLGYDPITSALCGSITLQLPGETVMGTFAAITRCGS